MKLARLLVGKNEVLYGKLEFIRYGIEIILMTIIGVAGMIIISIIMDSGCGWIPFLVSFALLRNCAGGYHAKNAFSCLLISELMFCIAVFVAKIAEVTVFHNYASSFARLAGTESEFSSSLIRFKP